MGLFHHTAAGTQILLQSIYANLGIKSCHPLEGMFVFFNPPLAVRQAPQPSVMRNVMRAVTVAAALKAVALSAAALKASLRCICRNKTYILPWPNHHYKMLKYIFLYYCSSIYQNEIVNRSRCAQAGFNKEDLNSLLFPLPPLSEQYRIVEKYEKAIASIMRG